MTRLPSTLEYCWVVSRGKTPYDLDNQLSSMYSVDTHPATADVVIQQAG